MAKAAETSDGDPERDTAKEIQPDLRIGIVLINNFTLIPVAGLVDSVRFAADESFRSRQIYCRWDWMTWTDEPVQASCGLQISPTRPLSFDKTCDYLVVAGGLLDETRNPPPRLIDFLRRTHDANIPIIALCSGSFVLGKAGLLDGKRCAVHFTIRDEFSERFPLAKPVVDKSYARDGNIITCPGGTAIDLAADIVARHCGRIRAQKGLEYLLVEKGESAPTKKNDERRIEPNVFQSDIVNRAVAVMCEHLDTPVSLEQLAEEVGVHQRQLHRAFISTANESPGSYWRKLRLENARDMLLNTTQSVTTIAFACGFADASHFILWFRKHYGEPPSSYRRHRQNAERLLVGRGQVGRGTVEREGRRS
jgi:transcriptional regulator GlxA family with amidase domain